MSLTREQAEQIVKEAIEQGWEGDRHIVKLDDGQEYNEGRGSVMLHDWDEINRVREERGIGSLGGSGCAVELKWPDLLGPKYMIFERDQWRQLKAKVDEIKEIILQASERGWKLAPWSHPQKAGKFGIMIELVPPGGSRVYPIRVGGMRTWRKLCREFDNIIEVEPPPGELVEGSGEVDEA